MKSRIINELHRLADGKTSDYGEALKQEFGFTDEQLKTELFCFVQCYCMITDDWQ